MPTLQTERLSIRPFAPSDLEAIYQILDVELNWTEGDGPTIQSHTERERWLRWTVLNYEQLAKLYQPPYGERAVVLKGGGRLIGAVGYVPCLNAFTQLPAWQPPGASGIARYTTTEFGLFYAFSPAYQGKGYATEAVKAMVAYAFEALNLQRIVATTTYDNERSMSVMRRLGMRIERNPQPEPPWLQVVGVLENDLSPNVIGLPR